jgi:uncharacterized protein (TIGR03086 family)
MSENSRIYTSVLFDFEHVLRSVPKDAWDGPSPCEGWSVRDVAGHAMVVVNNVAARAGIGSMLDAFENVGAVAGDDPVATFRAIRKRFIEAMDDPAAVEIVIESRLGTMTIDEYIEQMYGDTLVHTWDIARGAGLEETLDPDAVEVVYASYLARDMAPLRTPGRYDDEVEIETAASLQDKLLAFTGRTP